MDGFGILTTNNNPTKRLTPEMVKILKRDDVEVKTYSECGWFSISGWKGTDLIVHAHCNSYDDYALAMGIQPPKSEYGGPYGYY